MYISNLGNKLAYFSLGIVITPKSLNYHPHHTAELIYSQMVHKV